MKIYIKTVLRVNFFNLTFRCCSNTWDRFLTSPAFRLSIDFHIFHRTKLRSKGISPRAGKIGLRVGKLAGSRILAFENLISIDLNFCLNVGFFKKLGNLQIVRFVGYNMILKIFGPIVIKGCFNSKKANFSISVRVIVVPNGRISSAISLVPRLVANLQNIQPFPG